MELKPQRTYPASYGNVDNAHRLIDALEYDLWQHPNPAGQAISTALIQLSEIARRYVRGQLTEEQKEQIQALAEQSALLRGLLDSAKESLAEPR